MYMFVSQGSYEYCERGQRLEYNVDAVRSVRSITWMRCVRGGFERELEMESKEEWFLLITQVRTAT